MRTAVVAMAYGTPATVDDVPAYFTDIVGGRPVRPEAVEELAERYRRIGGSSPLAAITDRQAGALARELRLPVYVGMKHWTPRIGEAAARALEDGAERIVGLVLAPHYSRMSIGGYRERLEGALDGAAELVFIESWHDHSPFLDVLAERVRTSLASRPLVGERGRPHLVFTAHSLPERVLAAGDPYRDQLLETSRLVAERVGSERWSFAFQSESATGEPWLGPDILDELETLAETGVRSVLVVPIGFVSDHLEILWDIDVEAREKAAQLGLELDRTASLNDDPAFIRALASLVRQAVAS